MMEWWNRGVRCSSGLAHQSYLVICVNTGDAMKILVLGGCGIQGKAVLYDLSRSNQVHEVICADYDPNNLETFRRFLDLKRIRRVRIDAADKKALSSLVMQGADVVIDVLPPQFVGNVFDAALEAGVSLVNTNYAHEIRHLSELALQKQISVMPECGLDPGIDLVIYGYGVKQFDEIHVLNSYCGGIPEKNACDNPLNYKISWNWDAVLRSQKREAIFIKDGRKLKISPENQHDNEMIQEIDFPGLGKLEALPNGNAVFYTDLLGITKTIKETGRYSLRWPGWCAFWQPLKRFGFLSDEPVPGLSGNITPHQFMVKLMDPQLQYNNHEKDLAVMQNVFVGLKDGKKKKITNNILIERDLKTGLLAMSLGVGYSASIAAQMIANGEIDKKGILSPAVDIPYHSFMDKLRQRGIQIHEEVDIVP
jgi:saccharopine dehydrogenase-like NADP-dependent oxidoreductase